MFMPTLSFNINQAKFDSIAHAMEAFNAQNPENPVNNEDQFAEMAFKRILNSYLDRYKETRIANVATQLATCSDAVWDQITGLLGPP